MPVTAHRFSKAITSIHGLLVLVLIACAIALLRTHCESFGCMGIGIAWLAWACGFALMLPIGLLSCRSAKRSGNWLHLARFSMLLQAVIGLTLLCMWAQARLA